MSFNVEPGKLYVTATPIGNLGDITYRAVEVLKNVDFVICEDTRHTLKLLNHLEIKKRLMSGHSHNERTAAVRVAEELKNGKSAALVTDCGTPGISDPAGIIVEECRKFGISVVPVPGVSALIALLSVCGWNSSPFVFLGFLSNKSGRRQKELSRYHDFEGVIVFYESPHRIRKTLLDLYSVFGDKEIIVGREISKKFEDIYSIQLAEIADKIDNVKEKGEYVIAVKNELKRIKKIKKY